jgi:hypothetical protein
MGLSTSDSEEGSLVVHPRCGRVCARLRYAEEYFRLSGESVAVPEVVPFF